MAGAGVAALGHSIMKNIFWFLVGFLGSILVGLGTARAATPANGEIWACIRTFNSAVGAYGTSCSACGMAWYQNVSATSTTTGERCAYNGDVYAVTKIGTCPAGQSQSGGGCVPSGASAAQKTAAGTAAGTAAANKGLDSAAQSAANTKAQEVMDSWIAAGKSESEAMAAATTAGLAAGYDDVATRNYPAYQSAVAASQAAAATGRECADCFSSYYSAMQAGGVNPYAATQISTKNSDGTYTQYELLSNGKWDVYGVNATGATATYYGQVESIDLVPTNTRPVSSSSMGIPAASVPNTTTGTANAAVITSGSYTGRYTNTNGIEQISYFNGAGASVATATRAANGTSVCTNCPTGINYANDFIAASNVASISGGGVVSGGSGSGTSGTVKIDESGTASSVSTAAGAAAIDSAGNDFISSIQNNTKRDAVPWSFNYTLPTSVCRPLEWSVLGQVKSYDPCPLLERVRAAMAFLMYALCALYLWRSVTGAVGGK